MKQRKTLHLIGQAHLDPVWLWPWQDGCSEALMTMQSALDRMRETPDFCFTRSSVIAYHWAKQTDQRLFAEIRRRVRDGRWEVVNGWIEQPDCNLPGTESFIRQCLYGKRWLARELGTDVVVGYNVDSFGHSWGLPQILAKAGYRYYVFMRPQQHEKDLPALFWWEGPDGSRVLAWRIQESYGQSYSATIAQFEQGIRRAADTCFAPGFEDGAFFLGVGNHGGGPTKRQIEKIKQLQADLSLPRLEFSTLSRFFSRIEKSSAVGGLPVVREELQHHARGCYAARGEIKALNRRAERSLILAERFKAVAAIAAITPALRATSLEQAWWHVLFNQFHDIIAGACAEKCYVAARDQLGSACETGQRVAFLITQSLARRVNTRNAAAGVLFVMNPLPWRRKAVVQLDTFVTPCGKAPITHLRAADGKPVPLQWLTADACFGPHLLEWKKLTAVVDVPACGYRVYHLGTGLAPEPFKPKRLQIKIRKKQWGLDSFKSADNREMLAGPIGFVVIEDTSDTWGHGASKWRKVVGRPRLESSYIVEDGPVVKIVRQFGKWDKSDIIMDIITYSQFAGVELRIRVNWQQKRQILKLEIPACLKNALTYARMPGCVSCRVPNGEEEPMQDWLALEGLIGHEPYALGVINNSSYSYDCAGSLLRIALVRAALVAQHTPAMPPKSSANPWLDQGWQERKFKLIANRGKYQGLCLPGLAEEWQTPSGYVMDSSHHGVAPWEESFVEVIGRSALVTAIKPAEDCQALIIRAQEMNGKNNSLRINIPGWKLKVKLPLKPWAIHTWKIRRSGRVRIREVDLLEREH